MPVAFGLQEANGTHPGRSSTSCPGAASTARSTTGAPPPSGRCVTVPTAKVSTMVDAPATGTAPTPT